MEKIFKRIRIPATITTVVVFILLGAANGILGDFGTLLYQWILQLVMSIVTTASWLWLIILALSCILIGVVVRWQLTRGLLERTEKDLLSTTKTLEVMRQTLMMTNRLVEFDDWLQYLVPNLVSAQDIDDGMQRLMYELLLRATGLFEEPTRASVFLPDSDKKMLYMKYNYMMSSETIKRTFFDIEPGKTNIKRGIAGEAFLSRDSFPLVTHVKRERGQWQTDKIENYVFFDTHQPVLQYQSFVCIPIRVGPRPEDNLGVLCFDSQNLTVFDAAAAEDSELQKRLIKVASRFAAALQIYQQLKLLSSGRNE
jgi:hypothetical protein